MKSSLFLVATSALLASASPLRKRVLETVVVEEVVATVYVYEDGTKVPATGGVFVETPKNTPPVVVAPAVPTTTSQKPKATPPPPPPPPPAPKSSKAPEVKVPEVKIPTVKTSAAPKQTSTPPPPASNLGEYEKIVLEKHAIHRDNHSVAALEWDATLAQYAANTANGCVFEHDMNQGGGGYGQNLASQGSSGNIDNLKLQSAAQAVSNQWYNGEAPNYDNFYGMANPPSNVPLGDYGHFTQVVWKGTQKVGCATVKCPGGSVLSLPSWYTVCNYKPAGNFGGQYGNNVLKPKGLSVSVA